MTTSLIRETSEKENSKDRSQKKIRILVTKLGLDGHDRGALVICRALRDSGMEVIYSGLFCTPEQVVKTAIEEDVDVIAMSLLNGESISFAKGTECSKHVIGRRRGNT